MQLHGKTIRPFRVHIGLRILFYMVGLCAWAVLAGLMKK